MKELNYRTVVPVFEPCLFCQYVVLNVFEQSFQWHDTITVTVQLVVLCLCLCLSLHVWEHSLSVVFCAVPSHKDLEINTPEVWAKQGVGALVRWSILIYFQGPQRKPLDNWLRLHCHPVFTRSIARENRTSPIRFVKTVFLYYLILLSPSVCWWLWYWRTF